MHNANVLLYYSQVMCSMVMLYCTYAALTPLPTPPPHHWLIGELYGALPRGDVQSLFTTDDKGSL